MRNTEDWEIRGQYATNPTIVGFAGTIEISYSEKLEMWRYRVFDLSGRKFVKAYGTDPKLRMLLAKVTKIKGEWQKEHQSRKS